jgi:type II secretory pathway component GspD/PulD (secretin)
MLSVANKSWKTLCLYFFLAALTVAAHAEGLVTGLKVSEGANTVKIDIQANGSIQHRTKTLSQPGKAIVVDVFPAKLGSGVKADYAVNKGLVSNVHVKQYTDNTVRITVDAISLPEYKVTSGAGSQGLTLAVSTSTIAEGKPSTNPATAVETAPVNVAAAPKPASPKPAHTVAPAPMTKAEQPTKLLTNRNAPKAASKPREVVSYQGRGETVNALRPRVAPRRTRPYQKMVSLDFVNADLVYVIKVLAKEMGRNVYVGPGVEGSVTVTLKSVPVEGAMALILKMQENEFGYKLIEPNTIVVAPQEKLNSIADDIMSKGPIGPTIPVNAIRQEILLEKAPAPKVISFLESQYKNVKFIPHPTMNGFYVVGSKKDVLDIKSSIANLDRVPEPPAKPEREYVKVNYGDLNEVKGLLATLVPDVVYNVDARRNTLILEGSPAAIELVKETLAEIDKPVDQVMVDCKVVDLSENGRKQLGMTWSGETGALNTFNSTFRESLIPDERVRTGGGNTGTLPLFQTVTQGGPLQNVGLPIQQFVRSAFIIQNSIQLLQESGEAKIMASPRVGMISGKPSLIHIGDKFPIVYFDPRAGQFQVQYVDIGIKLDVKADVKSDGNVECEITPEVSTLVSLVNNQYPRTAVRRIQTIMRVKDGETIVVGGLIREEDVQSVTKVPLLGDLPILGAMFRSVNNTRTRNEVVVMMTPNVMR